MFSSGNTNTVAKINNNNISTQDFIDYLNKSGTPEKTIKENLENINVDYSSQNIVFPVEKPISPTGGVIGLKGNLAPDGAIVKVAGMSSQFFRGNARCFDCEEDAFKAVSEKKYEEGDVIVIRYEGPKGGTRMREKVFGVCFLFRIFFSAPICAGFRCLRFTAEQPWFFRWSSFKHSS